jgi:hypothetical protein
MLLLPFVIWQSIFGHDSELGPTYEWGYVPRPFSIHDHMCVNLVKMLDVLHLSIDQKIGYCLVAVPDAEVSFSCGYWH